MLSRMGGGAPFSAVQEGMGPAGMAPLLFLLLFLFHLALRILAPLLSKGRRPSQEAELVRQIKQLLREANALSAPATFAKSAKLRRSAAAKEKELAQLKQSSSVKSKSWLISGLSLPLLLKGVMIFGLGGWFRHNSVASIPTPLLQPFDRILAMKGSEPGVVHVRILPWLLLSSQVSSYLVQILWQKQRT